MFLLLVIEKRPVGGVAAGQGSWIGVRNLLMRQVPFVVGLTKANYLMNVYTYVSGVIFSGTKYAAFLDVKMQISLIGSSDNL